MRQKVLKLRIHQRTAVYRNPLTMRTVETYPLPPPSTVLGFLHAIIAEKKQVPGSIRLSIQGTHDLTYKNYSWYMKAAPGGGYMEQRTPVTVYGLKDVELIVHMAFLDSALATRVYTALLCPPYYPYIGRSEDAVKIESVRWVDCETTPARDGTLRRDTYMSEDEHHHVHPISATMYTLPGYCKPSPNVREFEWHRLYYATEGTAYEADDSAEVLTDQDGDKVFWCV